MDKQKVKDLQTVTNTTDENFLMVLTDVVNNTVKKQTIGNFRESFTINNLGNVAINAPQNGETLVYNSTIDKWENGKKQNIATYDSTNERLVL